MFVSKRQFQHERQHMFVFYTINLFDQTLQLFHCLSEINMVKRTRFHVVWYIYAPFLLLTVFERFN